MSCSGMDGESAVDQRVLHLPLSGLCRSCFRIYELIRVLHLPLLSASPPWFSLTRVPLNRASNETKNSLQRNHFNLEGTRY